MLALRSHQSHNMAAVLQKSTASFITDIAWKPVLFIGYAFSAKACGNKNIPNGG